MPSQEMVQEEYLKLITGIASKMEQQSGTQYVTEFFNDFDSFKGRKYLKWELEVIFGIDKNKAGYIL